MGLFVREFKALLDELLPAEKVRKKHLSNTN